jgi:hypothetical protein
MVRENPLSNRQLDSSCGKEWREVALPAMLPFECTALMKLSPGFVHGEGKLGGTA